jgi:hypothetical protein
MLLLAPQASWHLHTAACSCPYATLATVLMPQHDFGILEPYIMPA